PGGQPRISSAGLGELPAPLRQPGHPGTARTPPRFPARRTGSTRTGHPSSAAAGPRSVWRSAQDGTETCEHSTETITHTRGTIEERFLWRAVPAPPRPHPEVRGIRQEPPVTRPWTPARLERLFTPRSVVLVGASERSNWARMIVGGLARTGFPGRVELVNARGGEVFGRPAVARLADIAEPVDAAYVMVQAKHVLGALTEGRDAGIRNFV